MVFLVYPETATMGSNETSSGKLIKPFILFPYPGGLYATGGTLRAKGLSFRQIGKMIGVDESIIRKRIKRQ